MGMSQRQTLAHLNALPADGFATALGDIFEHAPWVAEAAAALRPFETVAALHDAMMAAVRAAPHDRQIAFLRGHPELGGKVARAGAMTADSVAEQGGLGLNRLGEADFQRFERLNAAYRERFGFPFIICVRRQTRAAILASFERRAGLDAAQEFDTAVHEIGHITRLRLVQKVEGPGLPRTDGRLSTHVLDTHGGRPAEGIRVRLYEVEESARSLIAETVTNADGRTDAPLMGGPGNGPLRMGVYEIVFEVGGYFRSRGVATPEPAFVDVVPLRFGIAEPEGHYHVPLLATPWSFSTYRGS
jgi:2-oxo-4-hydroxy-4-carboxy-5-ureidoimidazoline decarboxylase